MKKVFDLFKKWFNISETKKIKEGNTPVIETEVKIKERVSMGGRKYTETRFTASHYAKKSKNRMQGKSRNINHKRAA